MYSQISLHQNRGLTILVRCAQLKPTLESPFPTLRFASPTPRNASSPRSCRLPSRLLHPAAPSPPPLAVGTCFCLLPPPATDPRDGLRSRRRSRCGTGRGYARGGRRSCLIRAPLPSPPSSNARLSTASLRLLFAFDTRVPIKDQCVSICQCRRTRLLVSISPADFSRAALPVPAIGPSGACARRRRPCGGVEAAPPAGGESTSHPFQCLH